MSMSLSYVLLGLLDKGPLNGYAIKAIFDRSIAFVWQAELSQIYRELETLEKKGFLSSSIEMQQDRPNKRVYQLTESGRRCFHEWLEAIPETFAMPKRDEFMLRLFFGSAAGEEVVKEEFRRFLVQARATSAAMREAASSIAGVDGDQAVAGRFSRGDRYGRFLRRRAAITSEAIIRWAEECLEELEAEPGYE
jgi:PadR family transcriptional regulator AphA